MALTNLGVCLAVALLVAPGAANAQYRDTPPAAGYRPGQPDVMTPPPAVDPNASNVAAMDKFRHWYSSAHKPAIMLFWNRELTDETTTLYGDTLYGTEEVRSGITGSGGGRRGAPHAVDVYQSKSMSLEAAKRPRTGGTFGPMDTLLSSQLESAFQGPWLERGVKLVDRTALIRKMSATAKKGDRPDSQFLETVALQQGVDYLVEILPTATTSTPTGFSFLVRIKHLPSSTMVAQFTTQAQPASGPTTWVAVAGGFEKQRVDRTNPDTIGVQLAAETMGHFH